MAMVSKPSSCQCDLVDGYHYEDCIVLEKLIEEWEMKDD